MSKLTLESKIKTIIDVPVITGSKTIVIGPKRGRLLHSKSRVWLAYVYGVSISLRLGQVKPESTALPHNTFRLNLPPLKLYQALGNG